jgi:chromosome partitioning protein
MKLITLANEKGGVGKSTLAIHLAAALAINGQRVVIVDGDAQANTTLALGFAEQPGLYDLLIRDASFSDKLRLVDPAVYSGGGAKGELLLLPSNIESRYIADQLPEANTLLERFSELDGWADTVVFDTSPTPSLFHGAMYLASDYVIHPVVCEALAITGLDKSMKRVRAVRTAREGMGLAPTVTAAIVPNMYRRTLLHRTNLTFLKEQYGALVKSEIGLRTTWSEASQMSRTVFAHQPQDGAWEDAWAFVNSVTEGIYASR